MSFEHRVQTTDTGSALSTTSLGLASLFGWITTVGGIVHGTLAVCTGIGSLLAGVAAIGQMLMKAHDAGHFRRLAAWFDRRRFAREQTKRGRSVVRIKARGR